MAVLSTLHLYRTISLKPTSETSAHREVTNNSIKSESLTPYDRLTSLVSLSIQHYEGAAPPNDPEEGWYCSECGDGPYGSWQVSCANVNCHRHQSAGYHTQLDAINDPWMDHGRGNAPADGETVWFCSECGDGPYGEWQPACQICQHPKCTICKVEEK